MVEIRTLFTDKMNSKITEFWDNILEQASLEKKRDQLKTSSILIPEHRMILISYLVDYFFPDNSKNHLVKLWPSRYDMYGECIAFPIGSLSNSSISEQLFKPLSTLNRSSKISMKSYLFDISKDIPIPLEWPSTLRALWNDASNRSILDHHFSTLECEHSALDFFFYLVSLSYNSWILCEKGQVNSIDILRRPSHSLIYYYGIPRYYIENSSIALDICTNGYCYPYGRLATELFLTATSRQNNIIYRWDPGRIMFSSGNISEKLRMASYPIPKSLDGSMVIIDMYAGIGYFTLQILGHQSSHIHKMYSIEMNSLSFYFLNKNLSINNISSNLCVTLLGDNINFVDMLRHSANRILLGYLPSSQRSWSAAVAMLNNLTGGVLHLHENVPKEQIEKKRMNIENQLMKYLQSTHSNVCWNIKTLHTELVKSVAPGILHVVYDIYLGPH